MERDTLSLGCVYPVPYFNSHAHVERDYRSCPIHVVIVISTHTLTWSVTADRGKITPEQYISTHTLTWSVTVVSMPLKIYVIFQLTRSRGA